MKKTFIYCVFSLISSFAFSQQIKILTTPAPPKITTEFDDIDTSESRKKQIAYMGYLDLMELYCRQTLFFNYGVYYDCGISGIDNETVEKVLPLLKAGAQQYADFQFMYACVLSGSRTMIDCEGEKVETAKNYKYFDLPKAKIYFVKYLNNPNKKSRIPFGLGHDIIKEMINNVFPNLAK